jgi:hypothetical protein
MRKVLRAAFAPVAVTGALLVPCLVPCLAAAQSIDIAAPAPQVEAMAVPGDILRRTLDPNNEAIPSDEALAAALSYDPYTLAPPARNKPVQSTARKSDDSARWGGRTNPDGSGSIKVDTMLQTEWDIRIGGDLTLAGRPLAFYEPSQPLPGTTKEQRAGAAWANVAVPYVASVEVRLAPSDDQRKIGTTLQRSVPLGSWFSMTLENNVTMTESNPATAPAGTPPQVWGTARKFKFDIAPTGTTLAAASSNSSTEAVTHHTLSAEQKIYRSLNVTTSVTDPGLPTSSKKLTAGYKLDW